MRRRLSIAIDRSSAVPLYAQVAEGLERLIASGRLAPGSRLENEIALAEQLNVSRPTMRQAIRRLVDKGLVVRRPGIGTQVTQPHFRRPLELTSLYDDLARAGRTPRTTVLSFDREPATGEVAAALGVPESTEVLAIERLRFAGDEPLALLRNYLPADAVSLTRDELESRGLYELLRTQDIRLRMARQTIGGRRATAAEARLLGETRGAPVLTMTRTAYDQSGDAVEYGSHVYRTSMYSFDLTVMQH